MSMLLLLFCMFANTMQGGGWFSKPQLQSVYSNALLTNEIALEHLRSFKTDKEALKACETDRYTKNCITHLMSDESAIKYMRHLQSDEEIMRYIKTINDYEATLLYLRSIKTDEQAIDYIRTINSLDLAIQYVKKLHSNNKILAFIRSLKSDTKTIQYIRSFKSDKKAVEYVRFIKPDPYTLLCLSALDADSINYIRAMKTDEEALEYSRSLQKQELALMSVRFLFKEKSLSDLPAELLEKSFSYLLTPETVNIVPYFYGEKILWHCSWLATKTIPDPCSVDECCQLICRQHAEFYPNRMQYGFFRSLMELEEYCALQKGAYGYPIVIFSKQFDVFLKKIYNTNQAFVFYENLHLENDIDLDPIAEKNGKISIKLIPDPMHWFGLSCLVKTGQIANISSISMNQYINLIKEASNTYAFSNKTSFLTSIFCQTYQDRVGKICPNYSLAQCMYLMISFYELIQRSNYIAKHHNFIIYCKKRNITNSNYALYKYIRKSCNLFSARINTLSTEKNINENCNMLILDEEKFHELYKQKFGHEYQEESEESSKTSTNTTTYDISSTQSSPPVLEELTPHHHHEPELSF